MNGLKFLIDTQLPLVLAIFLRKKGFDTVHVSRFSAGHLMDDSTIRLIAASENRIIISKDADFFEAFLVKGAPPKALHLRFGNISNKELFSILDAHFEKVCDAFDDGADLIQLNRVSMIRF